MRFGLPELGTMSPIITENELLPEVEAFQAASENQSVTQSLRAATDIQSCDTQRQ